MAQSKINPKRKQKLINFKNSQKKKSMSQQQQEIPAFAKIQQRPYWSSQEDITLKGIEYESLINVANIFRDAVAAVETSMQRNLQLGKIKMKYFHEDGTELNDKEVEEYTKEVVAYYQEMTKKNVEKQKASTTILSAEGDALKDSKEGDKYQEYEDIKEEPKKVNKPKSKLTIV